MKIIVLSDREEFLLKCYIIVIMFYWRTPYQYSGHFIASRWSCHPLIRHCQTKTNIWYNIANHADLYRLWNDFILHILFVGLENFLNYTLVYYIFKLRYWDPWQLAPFWRFVNLTFEILQKKPNERLIFHNIFSKQLCPI